jgi:hypothetical protein
MIPPEPMGRVYINDTQYFDNVPEVIGTFYIGVTNPLEKMAQRPQGTRIILEDILHYQRLLWRK